jgi:hypothetical protein
MSQRRSTPIARRVRAALFHVQSVIVVVVMTIALAIWMLVGVVAAGISALFERRRARGSKGDPPPSAPRNWDAPGVDASVSVSPSGREAFAS